MKKWFRITALDDVGIPSAYVTTHNDIIMNFGFCDTLLLEHKYKEYSVAENWSVT
jgi:hypothetical protein